MSIHFWKFVEQRYRYLNWRLLVGLWAFILGDMFGLKDKCWEWGVWYGVTYQYLHMFFAAMIIVAACFAFYAMWKVSRFNKREMQRRREEGIAAQERLQQEIRERYFQLERERHLQREHELQQRGSLP